MRDSLPILQSTALFLLAAHCGVAIAIECTPPPSTVTRDYQGKIDIAVTKVFALRGPGGAAEVKVQARNLLDKLPNADKTLVELTYLYTLCTSLRDDRSTSEGEKSKTISSYIRAVRSLPADSSGPRQTKPSSPPSAAPAATVVQGNSGVTAVGNQAGGNLTVTNGGR